MFFATVSQSLIACWTTRLESPWIERRVAPQAFAMRMPWSSASYSASLFDALLKLIWNTYLSLSPLGEINTTPARLLDVFLIHQRTSSMSWRGLEGQVFAPPST